MGCSKSSIQRKVHSYTGLPQEAGKIPHKQSNFTPKGIRKRRTNKTQSKYKEGNNKIGVEINITKTKI